MTFITALLKNVKKRVDSELLFTDTDSIAYEIKSEEFINNFLSTNISLILVTIRKIQSFLTRLIKKLLAK